MSVVLLVAGVVLETRVRTDVSTEEDRDVTELLRAIDEMSSQFVAGSVVRALAYLVLPFVLVYLYRVVKARNPKLIQAALVLAVLGPVLFAAGTFLLDMQRLDIAQDFVSGGEQTEQRAEDQFEDRSAVAVALGAGGTLALALALVLLNVNAIRTGVLSRFIGILGVIAGVLFVLPLGSAGIIQIFWLGALVALFLDRWPGGRGPAWESGEAEPWPTAAQRRMEMMDEQERREKAEASPQASGEAPGADGGGDGSEAVDAGAPAPQKRKRKRRR